MELNRPRKNVYTIVAKSSAFFKGKLEKGGLPMSDNKKDNKEVQYIYRPWITVKGVKIYATAYGKKAFKIPVNR